MNTKEMQAKIASKSNIVSNTLMKVLLEKYGIDNIRIGHTRYASDGTIEHECAVHVEYRDGRTLCITDKGVLKGVLTVDEVWRRKDA